MLKIRFAALAIATAMGFTAFLPSQVALANDEEPNDEVSSTQDTGDVSPNTSNSGSATFPDGKTLTANAWIQSFTWTGCGNFATSAVMTASPQWIENSTDFYQIGLGSLTIKGVNIGSSHISDTSLRWKNTNGAKGSYLSGSVCGRWGATYVGMTMTGTAFYKGSTRIAQTRI